MIIPVLWPSFFAGMAALYIFFDQSYALSIAIAISIGTGICILSLNAKKNKSVFDRVESVVDHHAKKLPGEYQRRIFVGTYGETDDSGFSSEVEYFLNTIVVPEIPEVSEGDAAFWDFCRSYIWQVAKTTEINVNAETSIPDDPFEFERWTAQVLNDSHWQARSTQGSGDQGADVIAEKHGITCVLQCKLYGKPAGNKAVQEVFAAQGFYDAQYAAVVATSGYTKSAKQLASKNGVLLLNVEDLPQLADLIGV